MCCDVWTGQQVLVGEVDGDLIAKYTVLSGAYCLLRYIENCNGVAFSDHSIRCPPLSQICIHFVMRFIPAMLSRDESFPSTSSSPHLVVVSEWCMARR